MKKTPKTAYCNSSQLTALFVAFLEYYMLVDCRNRPECHTEATLVQAEELLDVFVEQLTSSGYVEHNTSGFATTKLHELTHAAAGIMRCGLLRCALRQETCLPADIFGTDGAGLGANP